MTREEAIKWLKNCALTECEDCKYINEPDDWCDIQVMRIARMLETLPDDLVRCKDCIHWKADNEVFELGFCCVFPQKWVAETFFCADGERREPDEC